MTWRLMPVDVACFEVFDFTGIPCIELKTGISVYTDPHKHLADLWFFHADLEPKQLKNFTVGERREIWKEINHEKTREL